MGSQSNQEPREPTFFTKNLIAASSSPGLGSRDFQKFPRELKKRLKMKALEREIDLQELCVKYLETGLAKDEQRTPTAANKK